MIQRRIFILTLVLSVTVFSAVLIGCSGLFKPVQTAEIPQTGKPLSSPVQTPNMNIPKREIKSSEVTSLSIQPFLTDFYEKNSKCSKSYNEIYGKEDGYFSSGPPCRTKIVFNRDGSADKTLEIVRWDKFTRQLQILEKNAWKAKINDDEFNTLNETIVNNDVFKSWIDGMSVNVTNCNIQITYTGGERTLMGNVDKNTSDFWTMINAFKKLDSEVKWEKVQ